MAAEQRREQLLDAALGVIVEQGYSRVSVEAVARAAGVTRPVVYDHFRDLGELLQALIEREERYSVEQLDRVLPEKPQELHPAAVLAGTVRRFLDEVSSRPATWTLILLPLQGTPQIVRHHVERNRAGMLARMETAVQWALERSQATYAAAGSHAAGRSEATRTRPSAPERPRRDTIDVELAARAMLGLAEDAGRMVLTDSMRYSPDRYEQFVNRVMSLLWPA